ncbi:toll/interleukin-1 receptor domain-containing protein [Dyella kyungheensis]|uniref:ADP-ribosyl cyclase/cyclic ADP-ribose hydrolase n=1 Tax=Dyella kyungheensis TaxID=1242174 RepID=A0ABS2JSY3_9GAMM|nr:toll/interleukin-1 receptor domain-containing protein [Dyella kyungheensis]MBM7121925.1 toll/interleukin-1 receptor domain-containing protein [Dyella kyungheensis]
MRFNNGSDVLFHHAPLSSALESQAKTAAARVDSVAASVLQALSDEELIDQLAVDLQVLPLKIDRAGMTMRKEEIQVDVTGDPRRMPRWDGGRSLIPGVRVTVSVPFDGDAELWRLRPSTFRLSAPRGQVRSQQSNGGVLDLVFEVPNDQLEQVKQDLASQLEDIEFFIENQRNDLTGVETRIRGEIARAVAARRARLSKQDALSDLLGIPEVKVHAVAPGEARQGSPQNQTVSSHSAKSIADKGAVDEWDVFVSHASEDKEPFVRALVSALNDQGLQVWYDEHSLRIGDSLRRSIDKGLAHSKFGVVVVSAAFLSKQWPQRELDGLVAREDDGSRIILPVWHNISAAEVRKASPTLADRLAISSGRGVDEVVKELMRVLRPA